MVTRSIRIRVRKICKKDLYDFIVYINNDEFWSNHFGQIYINQKQEIELIAKNGVYNIYQANSATIKTN